MTKIEYANVFASGCIRFYEKIVPFLDLFTRAIMNNNYRLSIDENNGWEFSKLLLLFLEL